MWLIVWIGFSILVGWFASSKRRSAIGWFFVSLIISPLISFIIVAVLGVPETELKKCPKCAEEIKTEAAVCRFCGHSFAEDATPFVPDPATAAAKKGNSELRNLAANYINKMQSK